MQAAHQQRSRYALPGNIRHNQGDYAESFAVVLRDATAGLGPVRVAQVPERQIVNSAAVRLIQLRKLSRPQRDLRPACKFLLDNFAMGGGVTIADDTSFMEDHVLDSTSDDAATRAALERTSR